MRIDGNDILVEPYPGLQEAPDTTRGALVPAGSRKVIPSSHRGTPESGRESSDTPTGARSEGLGRHTQDTVDIQKSNQITTDTGRYGGPHFAVAGMLSRGGPYHEYRLGSDGRVYALGSGVSLDVNTGGSESQKTLVRMDQVRRAALVPANHQSIEDQRLATLSRHDIQRFDQETPDQQDEQALAAPHYTGLQKGSYIDTWV